MAYDAAPTPSAPIGVLVVDDQAAVREGISRLMRCAGLPLREVRTAASAAEALLAAAQMRPEIVVLDVDLAGEDGLALIPRLAPGTAVVVLTCHGDEATRSRAAWLGARAFVEKHSPAAVLLESIAGVRSARMRGEDPPPRQGTRSPTPAGAASDVRHEADP